MSKGKYSISVSQGRVAHDHDNRDYTPHNADRGLRNRNVIIKQTEDYKSAFNELFRDSIEAYNAKQKREDRKKSYDYYSEIANGKGKEKPIYEYVLQIGSRDTLGVTDNEFDVKRWEELKRQHKFVSATNYAKQHLNRDPRREELKRLLADELSQLEERYPNFHFYTIVIHDDEPNGTCHAHIAFTPVADGYKNGMQKRDSLTKALNQMGFKTQKDSGLAISQWQNELKYTFEKAMIEAGYEREYMGNTEKHMCLIQFKVKKQNEELAEKNENLSEQNKKLAEENARLIQESRLALLEINKRQNECDDREKRLKETAELLYQADQEQQARELELRRRERRARADEVYDRMVGDQYKQDSSRRMPDNLPDFGM